MSDFLQAIAVSADDLGADAGGHLDATYDADADLSHLVYYIFYSFAAGPPAGTYLKIYDGDGTDEAQVIFKLNVVADGPGFPIYFQPAKEGTKGRAMTVRLMNAAADAGELNVGHNTRG